MHEQRVGLLKEINAYRGLLDILGLSGADNISANPLSSDKIKVSGHSIYVETKNPATLSVYNPGGTCIRIYHLQQGTEHIDMPDVTPGIYIIQLNSVDPSETGSQIIRL